MALKNSPSVRQCICFGPQRVESEKGVINRGNELLMNYPAAVLKDCLKMSIHLEDTHLKKNAGEIISILSVIFRAMFLWLDLFIFPVISPYASSALGEQMEFFSLGLIISIGWH